MIAADIVIQSLPLLHLEDKVSFALQNMEDYEVQQLAVVKDDYYIGLVQKDDLLEVADDLALTAVADQLERICVLSKAHVLTALDHFSKHHLSILPVVNEQQECVGVILQKNLNEVLAQFLGTAQPGAMFVLSVSPFQYSLAEMSRLVESNNAQISQLNTFFDEATGALIITIKINREDAQSIIATFQRYNYQVLHYFGNTPINNDIEEHYHHLMNYLDV
jgi:predicted transcriptional regulator